MDLAAEIAVAVAALTAKPVALETARRALPKGGGLYAWWIVEAPLVGVPPNKHPSEGQLNLLYVGIAPNRETSKATLHSRVVGNHMQGNIAASTFRRTLAALLRDELALAPIKTRTKTTLPKEDNAKLSAWQQRHLRLTWHATPRPWLVEAAVIAALRPPLNLADNATHPFHKTLSAARRRLQLAAR